MIFNKYIWLFVALIPALTTANTDFSNRLSTQGYTGLLNTPHALITQEKRIDTLYSNHIGDDFPSYTQTADSYLFSIGIWPNIELGGRLVSLYNQELRYKGRRDLSGNIKWQFLNHKFWPALAIGSQDFAGEARTSRSQYIVATKQISDIRLSTGYGFDSERLKGLFGGIEYRLIPDVYLIAEYDTNNTNYGLRITSDSLNLPFALSLTAKKSPNAKHSDFFYGIGISMPLTGNKQSDKTFMPHHSEKKLSTEKKAITHITDDSRKNHQGSLKNREKTLLQNLFHTLNRIGLEKTKVGIDHKKRQLFIEYENHRYNHNEMDALGLVLGIAASKAPENIASLTVLTRKNGIATLETTTQIDAYKQFLATNQPPPLSLLQVTYPNEPYDYGKTSFIFTAKPKAFRSELFLYPKVSTFVGTELGVIDSSIALQADWYLPLWKGASFNIAYRKELYHTADFNSGKPFARFRINDGFNNILFNQAVKPYENTISLSSIGQYENDYLTLSNDTIIDIINTPFRIRTQIGYYNHKRTNDSRTVAIGSIRYLYAPKNIFTEASFGKFWFEDRALTIEVSRYFEDIKITLFYKANDERSAGLKLSLPLTPRKDSRPSILQIKGANRWSYGLQTSIARGTNKTSNALDTKIAVIPSLFYNTENIYKNQGRLHPSYIKNNLPRLRNAYRLLFDHNRK